MSSRLLRAALALVPREWRSAVAHDLDEEAASDSRRAARALVIGLRLRLARTRDRLAHPHRPRTLFLRDFTRDLKFAVRAAVQRPVFSLTVVATLAIGIGANTAIFSVFNWILFRPIPGAARPSELVTVYFQGSTRNAYYWVSYRDIADLRDNVPALSALAASEALKVDVGLDGEEPERTDVEIVTAGYFSMFGVTPSPGRDFRVEEERPSPTAPPAIISHAMWKRRFGLAPSTIGRTLIVNGQPFTIVGVAPASFQGRSLIVPTSVWVPTGAHPQILPNAGPAVLSDRRNPMFGDAFGRLRPGATVALAQEQASAVAARTPDFAGRRPGARSTVGPVVYAGVGQDQFARGRLSTIFTLVMSAVGLLLIVACANAANVLLARSLGRRREVAVCHAIGASRFRIVRQHLAEGLVLASAAGAGGLALATLLTTLFDGMRLVSFLPAVQGVNPDFRVVGFTAAVSLMTGCVFAIVPAMTASRIDLSASLKDGLTTSRRGSRLLRAAFATAQMAIAILLIVGAGLFVRTLTNIRALDLGLRPEGVVSFSSDPTRQGYSSARAQQHFDALLKRLRGAIGDEAVALSFTTPYMNRRNEQSFTTADDATVRSAAANHVSRGYFATMGIPLVAGRDFTDAESSPTASGPDIAIVSQGLARMLHPAGAVIGMRLRLEYPKGKQVEIVGVAGDVRGRPITETPEPWIYQPAAGLTWGAVHVRSGRPLTETIAMIRQIARDVDPALPPYDIEPLSASVDRMLTEERLLARLSVVFAGVAALLAAVGIYGLMACSVGERTREFGIRVALGASSSTLLVSVVRSALTVALIGAGLGIVVAAGATRVIESRLFGVSRLDPASMAGGCALLVAISLVASAVPAWRASRIDPVRSLRVE